MILSHENKFKIVEEIFSKNNHENIAHKIVRVLSNYLDADKILISRICKNDTNKIETLTCFTDGQIQSNFEYDVINTPCKLVTKGETVFIKQNLFKYYPELVDVESYIGMPITDFNNNVIGHFCIINSKPISFDEDILDFIKIFANRIGSELTHQKLEKDLKINFKHQKILNDLLTLSLKDKPLKHLLDEALNKILSTPWLPTLSKGAIYLADEINKQLKMIVYKDMDNQLLKLCKLVSYGKCLCGQAALTKQIIHTDCIDERHETTFDGMKEHGHYVVPIKDGETLLGVLVLYLEEKHSRDKKEEYFLSTISNTLASIIVRKNALDKVNIQSNALEAAANSIAIFDKKGNFNWVNKSFTMLTGYTLQDVIGKNPRILKSEKQDTSYYKDLWDTILSGNVWIGELINKKKNGNEYIEEQVITPIFENGKICNFISIKKDITKKKQREEDLISAKIEADESNRLKSEFLAQISHEIRSPINTILNYSNLLRSLTKEEYFEEEVKEYHYSIDLAGNRIIRTIELLINMSQLHTKSYKLEFKKIDLYKDVIGEVVQTFKFQAEQKGLQFLINNHTENYQVKCDLYSISQSIINLVDNAIKYTDKGSIVINILRDENSKLILEITDSGIGMDPEFMENMFEPFVQEEQGYTRKYDGSGLGLALVKNYCDMNNVAITVESRKGKGTTFRLQFSDLY